MLHESKLRIQYQGRYAIFFVWLSKVARSSTGVMDPGPLDDTRSVHGVWCILGAYPTWARNGDFRWARDDDDDDGILSFFFSTYALISLWERLAGLLV